MKPTLLAAALALPLMLGACGPASEPAPPPPPPAPEAPPPPPPPPVAAQPAVVESSATAVLAPTEGNAANGTLTLTPEADGVRISGTLEGVPSGGTHGFHIHETGDCSAPDASSAGPHFNPTQAPHGHPGHGEHHAGDMPNLVADDEGRIAVDQLVPGVSLGGDAGHDVIGRAVVLHANADDYASQPAGDSGPRIACGVIHLLD